MDTPKIYVASLSDYNAGNLLGKWIDANQSAEEIREEITALLKTSKQPPAEEYAIHDYENFGPIKLSEWEDLETVARLAELLDKHGELFGHVYAHENDIDRAESLLDSGYLGEFDSLEEYAQQFLEECGTFHNVPDMLKTYFDFESYAHDLELNGDVWTLEIGRKVHVFDGHF